MDKRERLTVSLFKKTFIFEFQRYAIHLSILRLNFLLLGVGLFLFLYLLILFLRVDADGEAVHSLLRRDIADVVDIDCFHTDASSQRFLCTVEEVCEGIVEGAAEGVAVDKGGLAPALADEVAEDVQELDSLAGEVHDDACELDAFLHEVADKGTAVHVVGVDEAGLDLVELDVVDERLVAVRVQVVGVGHALDLLGGGQGERADPGKHVAHYVVLLECPDETPMLILQA